jgi:hypothetical protein
MIKAMLILFSLCYPGEWEERPMPKESDIINYEYEIKENL